LFKGLSVTEHITNAKKLHDIRDKSVTPSQRARRKIAREEALLWDEAARELGFTPEERQIAWERLIRMEDDLFSEEGPDD